MKMMMQMKKFQGKSTFIFSSNKMLYSKPMPMMARSSGAKKYGVLYGSARMAMRCDAVPTRYQEPEPTKETIETTYYKATQVNPKLITANEYWLDLARYYLEERKDNFISPYFAISSKNINEYLLMIATIELPFEKSPLKIIEDDCYTFIESPLNIVSFIKCKQLVKSNTSNMNILVKEKFYDPFDSTEQYKNTRVRKYLKSREFIKGKLYGLTVFITNVLEIPMEVQLLVEYPEGSIIIGNPNNLTKSYIIGSNTVQIIDLYFFYFPESGKYPFYSIHLSDTSGRELYGYGESSHLNVLDKFAEVDATSWIDVANNGTDDDVFMFIKSYSIYTLDLKLIYYRLKSKEFYTELIKLLCPYYKVDRTILQYSFYHSDWSIIPTYLSQIQEIKNTLMPYSNFNNFRWDVVEQQELLYKEYESFIEIRCHNSKKDKIATTEIHDSIYSYYHYISCKPRPSSIDYLIHIYYLFLLNRTQEAIEIFYRFLIKIKKSNGRPLPPDDLTAKLQYDSISAYIDCISDNPTYAKEITEEYENYPIKKWREYFISLKEVLSNDLVCNLY